MENESGAKKILIAVMFAVLAAIVLGLFWFFFIFSSGTVGLGDLGWYLFSFTAGLTMIVLPCTLPLAFVIVPLSMGKGATKGFLIALAFGLGVAITLSFYGVFAAALGKVAIGSLGAPLEVVKNWMYFIAGAFAFTFALGELGLVRFRMPTYSGALPGFIQKQQDVFKALLLGLFLGNIGVGCPHPATPVILTQIAVSGDVFYGWLLFFIHAIGRVLPLIFLAILGILGVNALNGLVKHKTKIERATGWGMVFVAGFILVLGFFSHDWWVVSGQHTFLESITQEGRFLGVIADRLNTTVPHAHGMPPSDHTGLFGLPLSWGTWVLLFLWIFPFFWYYKKRKREIAALADPTEKTIGERVLPQMFWNFMTLSLLLVLVFAYVLPHRFAEQAKMMGHDEKGSMEMSGDEHGESGMMKSGMEMQGSVGMNHGKSFYHEEGDVKEGVAVNLNVTPPLPEVNQKTKLDFFVNRKPGNMGIPESELEIQHEKRMHVIGVRKDLNEFFHVHPVAATENPALLTVTHVFTNPGEYKVWSEINYQGEDHVFGHPIFNVGGAGVTSVPQKEVTTNKVIGRYQVGIIYDHFHVGENHIDFIIKDLEGRAAILENYLGEKMHLSVISEDRGQFIHTHPDASGAHGSEEEDHHGLLGIPAAFANGTGAKATDADHISFTVSFQKPGFYKVFGQFRPADAGLAPDDALAAEFWIKVESAPATTAFSLLNSWWARLVISLILIAGLSWLVKRFVTVETPKNKR